MCTSSILNNSAIEILSVGAVLYLGIRWWTSNFTVRLYNHTDGDVDKFPNVLHTNRPSNHIPTAAFTRKTRMGRYTIKPHPGLIAEMARLENLQQQTLARWHTAINWTPELALRLDLRINKRQHTCSTIVDLFFHSTISLYPDLAYINKRWNIESMTCLLK